ncbi:MAG: 4-hydroxy-3-methylbut-2-enyl diphosphate reductase [Fibrobacteres bacterium]|nr:4-hydroxy-3-methylbut-2-enyl diphosphate reductase [Fibrobacterota bacterium]
MRIIIAKHSGFCMGVRVAMNTILKNAHATKEPLQTLGPLIHNPQTIDLLGKMNVTAVKTVNDITASTVVIRTHGIPPDTMADVAAKGVNIIDATCPHVLRIHKIIDEHYKNGYTILIYGDKGHAEVVGLEGFARERGYLIQQEQDINNLPKDLNKVCLVAQTTQSLNDWQTIKERAIAKYPDVKVFDTICRATDNRQTEVERLARISDVVVVVGGKNSANSTRLYEIAKAACPKSLHVETEKELVPELFKETKMVAIVSGASTPSWLLQRVSERLKEIDAINSPTPLKIPMLFWRLFVAFNGYLALGAAFMTFAAQKLQGLPANPIHIAAAALYIHSMYVLNRLTHIKSYRFDEIFQTDPILAHRKLSQLLLIITGLSALSLSFFMDTALFILFASATAAGLLYHVKIFPPNRLPLLRHRRPKDIPLSKDLGIAFAWSIICTSATPESLLLTLPSPSSLLTFLFVFATAFTRTLFNDLHDIQRDMIVGRETLPILMGKKFNKVFPAVPTLFITLIIISAVLFSIWPAQSLLLLVVPLWIYSCHRLSKTGNLEDETTFDAVIDFTFVLPAVILLIINNG